MNSRKLALMGLILALLGSFFVFDIGQYLNLEALKAQQAALNAQVAAQPWLAAGLFFIAYVAVTALSLPGAALMTLLAGALFGLLEGCVLVSFASTLGATLAMGLGGTRDGGTVWGEAWARAGFVVVHLQHPGSDLPAVRAAASSFSDKAGLRAVGSPAQLLARLQDTGFVLDQIGRRHAARQDRWSHVRPTGAGMSGHSFGAHTTLGMAGQRYGGNEGVQEPRLTSFIALSPTIPALGDAARAFERLTRPVLSITGTRDQDAVGNGATPERRMAVFGALPPGAKGHLVLQDADHMTFGGQTGRAAEIVPRESVTRDQQARDHALVASITSDWWRATLLDDAAARARLIEPVGLRAGDRWQQK